MAVDNHTNNGQHKYAYTYDYVGNRSTMIVTAGGVSKTHVYSYDATYQLTHVDYPPGFEYLATDTTFNYDAAGNRTSVIDGGGTTPYSTNNLNEYTSADGVSYQYDSSGNMTHDENYAYGYDPENRLVKVHRTGSLPPVSMSQALESPLTYTTGGDAPWLVTQTDGHGDGDSVYSSYDLQANQSNWLQTTVQGEGTFSFWWKASSSDAGSELYFYVDGQPQSSLTGDHPEWEQKSYTLSGTHTLKWTFSRSSDEEHSGAGFVDSVQWTGSALPAPEPPLDGWNRLAYTYDASGRRIGKSYADELITSYVYDGDHCLAEYDPFGHLRRKYIYGPGVDEPVCMIESSGSYAGTYYYHFDALGSVVALTNSSGNTVQVYDYDVYGRVGATDASHPNRFMFTGREYDKETGLYYYRARYYKPEIGRFLQVDTVGYQAGMNLYRYCSNNPWNSVDPLGKKEVNVSASSTWSFDETVFPDSPTPIHIHLEATASLQLTGITDDDVTWGVPPRVHVNPYMSNLGIWVKDQNVPPVQFWSKHTHPGEPCDTTIDCASAIGTFTWTFPLSLSVGGTTIPGLWGQGPTLIPPLYLRTTIELWICADGTKGVKSIRNENRADPDWTVAEMSFNGMYWVAPSSS